MLHVLFMLGMHDLCSKCNYNRRLVFPYTVMQQLLICSSKAVHARRMHQTSQLSHIYCILGKTTLTGQATMVYVTMLYQHLRHTAPART